MSIKRPPFKYQITDELEVLLNQFCDIVESGDQFPLSFDLLQLEIQSESRAIPGATENNFDDWIIEYYVNGGWTYDYDAAG
jgi:hypothetical protein